MSFLCDPVNKMTIQIFLIVLFGWFGVFQGERLNPSTVERTQRHALQSDRFNEVTEKNRITTTINRTVIVLEVGVTIEGSVYESNYVYYQFPYRYSGDPYDPNDPLKNSIQFDLQPLTGDADLLVSCLFRPTGDEHGIPSRQHFNYSSQRFDEDVISIPPNHKDNCASVSAGHSGVFYVGITGYSMGTARFAITAALYGGTRMLSAGLPVRGHVPAGLGAAYMYHLPDASAQQVTFTLTPSSGDADLYIKLGAPDPPGGLIPASRTNYDYRSFHVGMSAETVVVPESVIAACSRCWLSAYVDGYASATYELLVTLQDTTVELGDAVPQFGSVRALGYQRYVLHVGVNGTVQAVLTALSGGDQLTVMLSSTTQRAVVAGTSTGTRATKMSAEGHVVERGLLETTAVPPKCGVHLVGVDDTVSDSGDFTGGIPLTSLHVTVPAPQGAGCDAAHSFVDGSGCADAVGCLVYVSVYGGTAASGGGQPHSAGSNASYTVRASLRPDPPALSPGTANTVFPLVIYSLADGVPQADSIAYHNPEGAGHTQDPMNLWRYYAYQTEAGHEPLSVLSQATVGYLNLYVLRCPYRTGKECAFHGVLPNATNYLATSASVDHMDPTQSDYLQIGRTDNAPGVYVIGVLSSSYFVSYRLSATSSALSILALVPGVPVTDHVSLGAYDYFSFFFDYSTSANAGADGSKPALPPVLRVTLTVLAGDADLFVSSRYRYPSSLNCTWRSTSWGSDYILIDPSVPLTAPANAYSTAAASPSSSSSSSSSSSLPVSSFSRGERVTAATVDVLLGAVSYPCVRCTYYIAVFGYKDTAYTLSASTATTTKGLSDGVPLTDSVRPQEYADYSFVYLSSSPPAAATTLSTEEEHDAESLDAKGYLGHSYSAVVNDTSRDITVSITTAGALGVPALFITLDGTQPSWLHYDYAQYARYPASLVTSSLVTIKPSDPAFKAACYRLLPLPAGGGGGSSRGCVIKLAVYGDSAGTGAQAAQAYTLTLASSQPTLLRLDVPVTDSVAVGGRAASYRAYLDIKGGSTDNMKTLDVYQHSLRVALTQFSGHVQARLSCRAIQSGNVTRAASSAEWSMSADDWPVLDVPLLFALEKGCFGRNVAGGSAGKGYLYVLVEASSPSMQPSNSVAAAASYSLVVSVVPANASSHSTLPPSLTAVPLNPGVSTSGRVAEGQFAYYIVRPGKTFEDLRIAATVLQGDVDLYVSASWDARAIVAPSCPANCFSIACCIYVVISFSLASSSAGSNEDLRVPHETVRALCGSRDSAPGSTNPCYLVVGVVGSSSFIRSTDQSQGQGLGQELGHYSTEPSELSRRRETSLTEQSSPLSGSRRVLPAAEASTYTITASFQSSTVQLVTGQPARATARAGSALYYSYSVASPGVDVVLAVTPLYGDPDLYVSLAPNYFPSRTNYTWIAAAYETDVLTIQAGALAAHGCFQPSSVPGGCELFIAVWAFQNTSYTLLASSNEGFSSLVTLVDGQPQSGQAAYGQYSYYQYHMGGGSQLKTALTVTLTPTSGGDLDLFLVFGPPNAINARLRSSSSSSGFGARSVNTSSLNGQGYAGPSAEYQPGIDRYDYTSSHVGAGVGEQISVTANMRRYCTACTVYLAVYGYPGVLSKTGGTYTLAVSTQGLQTIPLGRVTSGHVDKGRYAYFAFFNAEPFARLAIQLSATSASGDGDLFVSTHRASANASDPMQFPTSGNYLWHSMRFGDDAITIDYSDKHYCSGCQFVVGVYGYRNTSFTLLVTAHADTVVRALPNVPLEVVAPLDAVRYFSVSPASSADDVVFTVTSQDTSDQAMYVQVYLANSSSSSSAALRPSAAPVPGPASLSPSSSSSDGFPYPLPDPHDPSSFKYSSGGHGAGQQGSDNAIVAYGPWPMPSSASSSKDFGSVGALLVVAVVAHTPYPNAQNPSARSLGTGANGSTMARYSLLITTSPQRIVLLNGRAQNGFVGLGQTVLFSVQPEEDADLRIALVARSGDPDLLVSSDYPNPHCARSLSGLTTCSNYTWTSSQYSSDLIVLSRDFPCSAVIPSTRVSSSCSPTDSYRPSSHRRVSIGVYGYSSSSTFTIVAGAASGLVPLPAGAPLMSSLSPAYECALRDPDTGRCVEATDGSDRRQVLAAYFSFTVLPDASGGGISGRISDAVIFSVTPTIPSGGCGSDDSKASVDSFGTRVAGSGPCAVGCDCNPLLVYVTACAQPECTARDRRPNGLFAPANFGTRFTVDQDGTTVYLSSLTTTPSTTKVSSSSLADLTIGPARAHCDPSSSVGPCVYFLAVVSEAPLSPALVNNPPAFQISARTPGQVTLVPCSSPTSDGLTVLPAEAVLPSTNVPTPWGEQFVEVCRSSSSRRGSVEMVVDVEACSGEAVVRSCPLETGLTSKCPVSPGNVPATSINIASDQSQAAGNIFLAVNGSGQYVLRLRSLIHDRHGIVVAPPRLAASLPTSVATANTRSGLSSGSDRVFVLNLNAAGEVAGPIVTLQWAPVSLLLPAIGQPQSAVAAAATYTAYVVAEGPMREYGEAQLEKAKRLLPPCPARQSSYGSFGSSEATKASTDNGENKGGGYGIIGWELPCVDAPWRLDNLCGLQRAAATLPVKALVTRMPLLLQASPPANTAGGSSSDAAGSSVSQVQLLVHSLGDLPADTPLRLIVVATCDAACLRKASLGPGTMPPSPALANATIYCGLADRPCAPVHFLYSPVTFTVLSDAGQGKGPGTDIPSAPSSSQWSPMFRATIGASMAAGLAFMLMAAWWYKRRTGSSGVPWLEGSSLERALGDYYSYTYFAGSNGLGGEEVGSVPEGSLEGHPHGRRVVRMGRDYSRVTGLGQNDTEMTDAAAFRSTGAASYTNNPMYTNAAAGTVTGIHTDPPPQRVPPVWRAVWQASSDVTTDLWERGTVAAVLAGEAGLGLAEQAGDALGFSVALTAASRNAHAQQSYSQAQGGQVHGQHHYRYRGLNMDGSTHPINTTDDMGMGPSAHAADGRGGGYVPPDIVTTSAGPLEREGASSSSRGPEMELAASAGDNMAVTLDLYAALTNNNNNNNNDNVATVPATDISSV